MEFRLDGDVPVGIYLVNKTNQNDPENQYSVCMVAPADELSELGTMYFKPELNPKEWFFLPEGMEVKLTN